MPSKIYIGTAGWSIPRPEQRRFPAGESLLARYAKVLPAVEVNSTYYAIPDVLNARPVEEFLAFARRRRE